MPWRKLQPGEKLDEIVGTTILFVIIAAMLIWLVS